MAPSGPRIAALEILTLSPVERLLAKGRECPRQAANENSLQTHGLCPNIGVVAPPCAASASPRKDGVHHATESDVRVSCISYRCRFRGPRQRSRRAGVHETRGC